MTRGLLSALLAAFFWMVATPAAMSADEPEIYTSWRNNVAVQGYDVVSFHAGKPVRGVTQFTTIYKGATWRFNTQANLDLFLTNPEAFEPQYGGYCAWAVAKGKLAPGKAAHWHVEDGRLYLNYSKRVKLRWDALRPKFIREANANWPGILLD